MTTPERVRANYNRILADYNIELAVQWLRIFHYEAATPEERARVIWEPTQALLRRLADEHPAALRCTYNGILDSEDFGGACADVLIVMPGNEVAFLGKVLDRASSQENWRSLLNMHSETVHMQALLKRGPQAVIRDCMGCYIPVDTNQLDVSGLADGVKRYMSGFMPALADVPVEWLSEEEGIWLWFVSLREAKRRARMSKELKEHILSQEVAGY